MLPAITLFCSIMLFAVCFLFNGGTLSSIIWRGATQHEFMVYGDTWPDYIYGSVLNAESIKTLETHLYLVRYSEEIAPSSVENIQKADYMIGQLMDELSQPMTDADRIDRISEWICDHLSYDNDYIYVGPADALSDGKGVCWHYAYLFKALCEDAGIECKVIEGDTNRGRHAWNEVICNSQTYYFDLTGEDANSQQLPEQQCVWLDSDGITAIHQ